MLLVACALGLALSILLGVALGSGSASLADALLPGTPAHDIVVGYRLPRVLLAAVAGTGLASVGASFQALLRNPLAEPYVLGVSGGAALGATLAMVLGLGAGMAGAAGVPLVAFAGGLVATAVVWWLARGGHAPGASILLAGVVVNAIAGAGITLLEAVARPGSLQTVLWWLMGFLDVPSWSQLAVVAALVALGVAALLRDAPRMNLVALGQEPAESLGVDVRALERRALLACAVVVGAVVSLTGLIGFLGLVVPQAVRRVAGPDLRVALPSSALLGGAVLVLCDLLVRLAAPHLHTEIPVGAFTALVGGPAFLVTLRRSSER